MDPVTTTPKYTARILPPAEWATAKLPYDMTGRDPDWTVVAVVETDGQIIASWMALNTVHLEGLHVDEAHRYNPGVAGRLFGAMMLALQEIGVKEVVTIAETDEVRGLAEHVGFVPLPGTLYKLGL